MRISKFMFLGTLPLLTGPVLAEDPHLRDLTVEQSTAAQARTPQSGSLQVSVSVDRTVTNYAIGKKVPALRLPVALSVLEERALTAKDEFKGRMSSRNATNAQRSVFGWEISNDG
jgi:hypothetical protein